MYHPQMLGVKNGIYLLAGEDIDNIGDIYFGRIVIYKLDSSKIVNKTFITGKMSDNSHAVLAKLPENKIIIAWTKHKKSSDEIAYCIVEPDKL